MRKRTFHKEFHDINAEKERFRESYNRAVHEINRVTRENERLVNETFSSVATISSAATITWTAESWSSSIRSKVCDVQQAK